MESKYKKSRPRPTTLARSLSANRSSDPVANKPDASGPVADLTPEAASSKMPRAEAAVGARNSKQPSNKIAIVVKATAPIEYLDVETTGFEQGGYGPETK